jgi:predicted alpha/beta-hydrolase family hydrolase
VSVTATTVPLEGTAIGEVRAAVHEPAGDATAGFAALLTPGAGGDLDGAALTGLATILADLGVTVVRANLPHHEAGSRAPRADRAVPAFAQLLTAARAAVAPRARWVAGGKSFGGRVASLAAADGRLEVMGLLFLGYPLHPPGKPDHLRVDHWPQVPVKTLFLQGERDPFGTPPEVDAHLTKLPRRSTLVAVPGGDHSLDVAGVHAPDGVRRPAIEVLARLGDPIGAWLRDLVSD